MLENLSKINLKVIHTKTEGIHIIKEMILTIKIFFVNELHHKVSAKYPTPSNHFDVL